jgi:hypothetical protein
MVRHIKEKRQRCPRCGEWLRAESVRDWEKKHRFEYFMFPQSVDEDVYICPNGFCGYSTEALGSDNRRIQRVLKDLIRDFMQPEERKKFAAQSHDEAALTELYESLAARIQLADNTNAMAALIIGLLPQEHRDEVIQKTSGLPVDQIMATLEQMVLENPPEYNFGDLAVALTL